jgi:hypothetical protein
MKIIIIGKRDQMGTTPAIRVKGMSQVRYNFIWDKEIRHYAYEPKNQKEVDDIFRTQGKLYKTMFFSVWLEPEIPESRLVKEGMIKQSTDEAEAKTKKPKAKGRKQPVEKEIQPA